MVSFRYEIEISHPGLNKYRHISGTERRIVEQKANSQMAIWEEQFARKLAVEARAAEKERIAEQKEVERRYALSNAEVERQRVAECVDEAADRTRQAESEVDATSSILKDTLVVDDAIDWSLLFERAEFFLPQPEKPELPEFPVKPEPFKLLRPDPTDLKFAPKKSLTSSIFPWVMRRHEKNASDGFNIALERFDEAALEHKILSENWEVRHENIKRARLEIAEEFKVRAHKWLTDRQTHINVINEKNDDVSRLKTSFEAGEPDAVEEYFSLVLERSAYPDFVPRDFEVQYQPEGKFLVVEFRLPNVSDLPNLKEVRYVKARDAFDEKRISNTQQNRNFDSVVAQIALRTIHEVFESDNRMHCETAVFNGYVSYVDQATGQDATGVLITVSARRDDFLKIDLARVEPVACLRSLKAVFAPKIHSITPVRPLISISREDKRFVSEQAVIENIEDCTNIAAMRWEDFEHLVRELFEKEFSTGGGEVKVTRASRDGGVDAIAFDPDPIRGGKIVIQAKRYTNVVGVSAVRDLYGTVLNEGATKGILVTTSRYGSDAFEFAKGKPITLLDGSNLLFLLDKHGTPARIDIEEAKNLRS